ncbi:MAG: glycosyltransferase family 2 protein [Lachnospiraceae bacterium]|nr:glycosyltransferase family 2 protein [Lachnospiraceae bacterium]
MDLKLSIIVPCFNEEDSIPVFYTEASKILGGLDVDYEICFINDGSDDGTLQILKQMSVGDEKIKYISFSRNFGKEAALYAGFCNVSGDYVAVMDVDMQDPPSLLPEMLDVLRTDQYDCVATRRIDRSGEPVDGWASTICIMGFIGGIQLFCMGIMGQYIAKTYTESKKRPHYIITDSNMKVEKIK